MIIWNAALRGFEHPNCKQCGEPFIGRKNRQFCSDGCKIIYNNDLASKRRGEEKNYVGPMLNNIRILESVMRERGLIGRVAMVSETDLQKKGFDSAAPFTRASINGELWLLAGPYRIMRHGDGMVEILLKGVI